MGSNLFDGLVQWELTWRGRNTKLPVFYYDNTSMTAIFSAATAEVRRRLPDRAMRPVELWPGRALVAVTAFEYRHTDIDPYCEVSIAFLITYGAAPLPAVTVLGQLWHHDYTAYVWKLPVTTEIARAAGVELYGYPKFLADITLRRDASWLSCQLTADGERVLTLKGRALAGKRGPRTRYVTYSVKDGKPLVANVLVDPIEYAESSLGAHAELALGSGPIADELRALRLSSRPVRYQYSPLNHAVLFAPRNLVDS